MRFNQPAARNNMAVPDGMRVVDGRVVPNYLAGPSTPVPEFRRAIREGLEDQGIGSVFQQAIIDSSRPNNTHFYGGASGFNIDGLWRSFPAENREAVLANNRRTGMARAFPDIDQANPDGHVFAYETSLGHEMWHRLQQETRFLEDPDISRVKDSVARRFRLNTRNPEAIAHLITPGGAQRLLQSEPNFRRQLGWPADMGDVTAEDLETARTEFLGELERAAPAAYRRYTQMLVDEMPRRGFNAPE